jgi:hypothetical protein
VTAAMILSGLAAHWKGRNSFSKKILAEIRIFCYLCFLSIKITRDGTRQPKEAGTKFLFGFVVTF